MQTPCSLPTESTRCQEIFRSWIDRHVQRLVGGPIERALDGWLQEQLQAAWNQRTPGRRDWHNGYRQRRLMTPHGVLTLRVPRT